MVDKYIRLYRDARRRAPIAMRRLQPVPRESQATDRSSVERARKTPVAPLNAAVSAAASLMSASTRSQAPFRPRLAFAGFANHAPDGMASGQKVARHLSTHIAVIPVTANISF